MRSMGRQRRAVKGKRPYDASSRRELARRNRSGIIEAAERRFLNDGYAPTTIAAIAADAAVSVDTIYKSFGGKPGLVRAIREQALRGARPLPAEQRSDELHTREPILLLLRDAARTDPELGVLLDEMDSDRLRRMTDNARRLHAAGHLRSSVTVARAADVMWTYSSPELYELMVLRRGMPLKHYGRFVADAMIAALL
jgi:AcrR family transcriptional regulator